VVARASHQGPQHLIALFRVRAVVRVSFCYYFGNTQSLVAVGVCSLALDKERLFTLDGMRGVAALLVAVYHYRVHSGAWNFPGYLAVDFFLLLSGYVIALSYERKLTDGMPWHRFCEIRLVRLFPLYAAGLAFGMLLSVVGYLPPGLKLVPEQERVYAAFLNAGLLPSPWGVLPFPFNNPSWSLFAEIVINVIFSAALFRFRSSYLLAGCAISAVLIANISHAPDYMNLGWNWATFWGGMARAAFAFPLGIVIFRNVNGRSLPSWMSVPTIVVLALLLLFTPLAQIRVAVELVTVFVLFPILLVVGAKCQPPRQLRRIFGLFGDVSYPIYVLHYPLVPPAIALAAYAKLAPKFAVLFFVLAILLVGWLAGRADAAVRIRLSNRLRLRRSAAPQRDLLDHMFA
jgi:peptidoglycan/LPS O-acetylase OafA/YrhL